MSELDAKQRQEEPEFPDNATTGEIRARSNIERIRRLDFEFED